MLTVGIGTFMKKRKEDKVREIRKLFKKLGVLTIEDLYDVIGTTQRRTVLRYIKELKYLTSYTHNNRYYALEEQAKFDEHGLWQYEDIGFSKHGSLFDTITYFIENSESGLTNGELEIKAHTIVKYALVDLIGNKRLARAKPSKVYVYLSSDQDKAREQLKKRQDIVSDLMLDSETEFRVLLAVFKCVEEAPSPEMVAKYLKKEGSKISLEVVRQVFQRHKIEKKTLDSTSSRS